MDACPKSANVASRHKGSHMLEHIVLSIVIALCGLFAIFCSLKDYDWFMENRRAKAISSLIGRKGTRVFYTVLGLVLVVVGVVVLVQKLTLES